MEVHASRDITWNKHRPMVLKRQVTLLQAYLPPFCPGSSHPVVQAASKLPVHTDAIRLQSDCTTAFKD